MVSPPPPMEAYKYTPRCVHWTWIRGYPIITSANKKNFTKKKKTIKWWKTPSFQQIYAPAHKMMPITRTQNGAKRLFWLEFLGLVLGQVGIPFQKLEVITVGFLAIVQHHQLKVWERGNTSSTPRLGKLIAIYPMGGRWFERSSVMAVGEPAVNLPRCIWILILKSWKLMSMVQKSGKLTVVGADSTPPTKCSPLLSPVGFGSSENDRLKRVKRGRGNMSVASRVLLISMPLPGFLPPNFEAKFLELGLCLPWRNVFSGCPRRSPPRPGAVGHVSTPQPKITCEKKQGVGIPRLLGLEWNLGVWLFFFGGCKKKSIQKIGVGWRISESLRFRKNGWTWQSFVPSLEWLHDPFKG